MKTDTRNTKGMEQRSGRLAVFLLCAVSALSCGPERPDKADKAPAATTELMLSPSNPQIAQGTFEQFSLRERLPSGRIVERRAAAEWHVATESGAAMPGSADGLVALATPGRYLVTASYGGQERSTVVVVTAAAIRSLTLNPTAPKIAKGTTQAFKATATFTDGTMQDVSAMSSWSIKDTTGTSVAVINSLGVATGRNVGKARVTARYMMNSATATLEVTAPTLTTLTISPTLPTLPKGSSQQFTATANFSDGTSQDASELADWSVADVTGSGVASIDGIGVATGEVEGEATVSADYLGKTASTTLKVTPAVAVSLTASPSSAALPKGTTQQLTITARLSDGSSQDVTKLGAWTSIDRMGSGVASVDTNGLVRANTLGTASIEFAYRGLTASIAIEIKAAVIASLSITPASVSLASGRSQSFKLAGTYSDGTTQDLTASALWSASDVMGTGVVSVSAGGSVQGKSTGEARVRAEHSGKSTTATVTVTAPVLDRIDLSPLSPGVEIMGTQQFSALGVYSDGSTQDLSARVTWSATDIAPATGVATISATGLATGKAFGRTTITASFMGLRAETILGVGKIKAASMFCSVDSAAQADVKKRLMDLGMFSKLDDIDMGPAAPTLATLKQYAAILVWADTSRGCSDPTATGDVLAQYVDAGGGVVQILPYYVNYTSANLAGDFYTRYSLVTQGSMTYRGAVSLGTKTEMHSILADVAKVSSTRSCYYRNGLTAAVLRNGGRLAATWSDGNGMVVVGSPGGHNRVDLNLYVVSSDLSSGCLDPTSDAYRLVGNSLLWVAGKL